MPRERISHKICKFCGELKSVNDLVKYTNNKYKGYRSVCKSCYSKYKEARHKSSIMNFNEEDGPDTPEWKLLKLIDEERQAERLQDWKNRCIWKPVDESIYYDDMIYNPSYVRSFYELLNGLDKYLTKINCKKIVNEAQSKF